MERERRDLGGIGHGCTWASLGYIRGKGASSMNSQGREARERGGEGRVFLESSSKGVYVSIPKDCRS